MNKHYEDATSDDPAVIVNRSIEATLALAYEQRTANLLAIMRTALDAEDIYKTARERLGLPQEHDPFGAHATSQISSSSRPAK